MKNLLIMQENEFSGTISMYPSTVQPFCTHVDKLATSNLQICFPAPYLSLHAKYSHMPNMTRGRTSPGLPYPTKVKAMLGPYNRIRSSAHYFFSFSFYKAHLDLTDYKYDDFTQNKKQQHRHSTLISFIHYHKHWIH